MPSPGGELYTSVSLLISTFIQPSLSKKHQICQICISLWGIGRDVHLNTGGIQSLGEFVSVKHLYMKNISYVLYMTFFIVSQFFT